MKITFTSWGDMPLSVLDVSDLTTIERVMSHFPQAFTGDRSLLHGGWVPAVIIETQDTNGRTVTITVSSQYNLWTCGHGDWPIAASELKQTLATLVNDRTL